MNSSDSGEDFESADEDFDLANSQKHTENRFEHVSSARNIGAEVNLAEPSSKESDKQLPIEELNSLQLKETLNIVKPEENASKSDQNSAVMDEDSKENRLDGVKTKLSSKKLGTRLTGNKKIDGSSSSSAYNKLDATETKKYNSFTDVEKEGENRNTVNIKTAVSSSTQPAEPHLMSLESNETKDRLGDGWEIEEEDELDIPVSLTKLPDRITPNNQEKTDTTDRIRHSEQEDSQGWGGWGGWGVSSLISTATGSVSSFSSQVTAGLSTVLESTVGAPDPETLAAASVGTAESTDELSSVTKEDKVQSSYSGFGSLVSGVGFLGSTVISRGLDTLESLGKKTMEVLQEGDPGLMKKRAMLFPNQDKPVLSQILREAKEKAENSDKETEEKETARKAHFESLFDDFHGMVHLEALEMLSTQCELKLQSQMQSLSGEELGDFQETLAQVRDLCELSDEEEEIADLTQEEFAEQITKYVDGLKVKITAAKIIHVNSEVAARLDRLKTEPATIVNQASISSLAEFAAAAMECFHKSAELLLAKSLHNTPEEAENYIQLTSHLCARVSAIANEFTQLLTKKDPIANSLMITNIFLEASNSCSYIRNACQLLVPILQVGALSS